MQGGVLSENEWNALPLRHRGKFKAEMLVDNVRLPTILCYDATDAGGRYPSGQLRKPHRQRAAGNRSVINGYAVQRVSITPPRAGVADRPRVHGGKADIVSGIPQRFGLI